MKILSKNELENVSGGVGFFQALGAIAKKIYCGCYQHPEHETIRLRAGGL